MATTLVSVEEYLNTSYLDGDCEYVDGEIVERNVGEIDHSDLQTRIAAYFLAHYPMFWAAVEARVQVKSTRFRVPDVVLVAGPKPAGRIITTPPHLVVEVLSPEDRAGAVQERIDDYLAFGIPFVWVVNPRTGRGYVHTTEAAREAKDGILRAADPAIELPLRELLGK
ncbi:MAG TPA: Uma2 family endonuclease [Bryobacteraceae bacterium]|nr:Uma2 family endonuclease [Bryobacteraceae bacterium]